MSDTRQAKRSLAPKGAYQIPAKRVKAEKFDVGGEEHQQLAWEENKKKITRLINQATVSNVKTIVTKLIEYNLVRYKGLFATALLRAQISWRNYTEVYAAILSAINSRFPSIGRLVINRIILDYRVALISNKKDRCVSLAVFIAHLINQEVAHEILGFELIEHLIEATPKPSSIEIVTEFLGECGAKLEQLSPAYLSEVYKSLRELSLDHNLDSRTHELIDLAHQKRKDRFSDKQPVRSGLDLILESDRSQYTRVIHLNDPKKEDFQLGLNYFKFDPNWKDNEARYESTKKILLGEESPEDDEASLSSGDDDDDDDESASSSDNEEADTEVQDKKPVIDQASGDIKPEKVVDATGGDLVAFRRMVYLTIRSSIRHEEVVHKLLKSHIPAELRDELCQMILDCCGQERTYEAIYGLVASKFCQINRGEYATKFERLFQQFYEVIDGVSETNKIRNISKFYVHLLTTESIDWSCLSCLKLREDSTTSPGRCFIKFLFQELVSVLSLKTLKDYIKEPDKERGFSELFPKEPEQDTRFAINFFTFSDLSELAEDLRESLLSQQKGLSESG